jgi:hypothetical protein
LATPNDPEGRRQSRPSDTRDSATGSVVQERDELCPGVVPESDHGRVARSPFLVGTFRSDLTIDELVFLFGQLLQATARMTAEHLAGVEKAAALVTSVFLHGTENRQDATAKDRAIRRHADTGPQEHSNQENGNSPDKTQG